MKKKHQKLSIFLSVILAFALVCTTVGCGEKVKPATPAKPNNNCVHADVNKDGICDDCGEPFGSSTPPDENCDHADADNNGVCDICSGFLTVVLDFYVINDIHGKFDDSDTNEGVDELTTYLKQAVAADESAILLSSGDTWQGAAASNLTHGYIFTDWMNEMNFAAMTLGNHEFDWGVEVIRENAELAEFPILAINIYDKATDRPVDYCEPSVMVEQDGLKIGIIGAIGDCYSSISSDKVEDVYFKTGSDLTALVKAESDRLRAQGADIVAYSIHDGYGKSSGVEPTDISSLDLMSYYDIELSEGYVDVVFEGHTHQSYVMKDRYNVYHLQNGGDNKGISHIELVVNPVTDTSEVREAEIVTVDEYAHLADDPLVDSLLEKYKDQIAVGDRILGDNSEWRDGNELRQKLADLYYEFGLKQWGDKYQITLGGGYFSIRSPGSLDVGNVKYSHLMSLFPFDNELVLCSVKGSNLERNFFNNTTGNYFLGYGDYGESVKNNIDPNATYYIVVDKYTSTYAPNRLTEIETYGEALYARDLLARFIQEGGFETPQADLITADFATVLEIGNALGDNDVTDEKYMVHGKIVAVYQIYYGNMIIEDENGRRLTVYGTFDENGTRYGEMSIPPAVGDTVTFTGPIKKFVSGKDGSVTVELINATMTEIAKG